MPREDEATDEAPRGEEPEAAPIDWPQCEVDDCIGVQAPKKGRCLAHLAFRELYELLQAGLTAIDLRGVEVNSVLLQRVVAALPVGADQVRVAEDSRFDHATFTENVHFLRVGFGDSCTFRNVTTKGLFTFAHCRFEPRFAVIFGECSFEKGMSISDSVALGRIFLANSSAESVMIKNSRFEEDLVVLKLAGTYLFLEGCRGSRVSVQDCRLKLGSLKNSEFGSIETGALTLEESFLLTRATGTTARLGAITAGEQILIDQCEFGGAESIGPLQADLAVRLQRSTLTTRRSITVEGGALDLTDTRFSDGVTITTSAREIVLDETHYGGSSLIAGSGEQQPRLRSAQRADLQNLAVDNLDLSDCAFSNAHNLDALRLRRTTFATSPSGIGGRPFRAISRRRVLLEERLWRARRGSRGWPALEGADAAPNAAEIAELYRSFRSGLERARNEPGAADFYYGEMEMRRHDHGASHAERAILNAYWALAGYGLRASRSLLTLAALVLVFSLGFWSVGFQGDHPSSFWPALTYAAGAATWHPPTRHLTTIGEALSIAFRLLGPTLLGLAVLSIRGRVRR